MFLPMSCTSPFTVAITIRPLLSPWLPLAAWRFDHFKSSLGRVADCSSCGKKMEPFSKASPTTSSAGISVSFTTCKGSRVSASSAAARLRFQPRSHASTEHRPCCTARRGGGISFCHLGGLHLHIGIGGNVIIALFVLAGQHTVARTAAIISGVLGFMMARSSPACMANVRKVVFM